MKRHPTKQLAKGIWMYGWDSAYWPRWVRAVAVRCGFTVVVK